MLSLASSQQGLQHARFDQFSAACDRAGKLALKHRGIISLYKPKAVYAASSVATLLLRESTRFYDEKTLDSQKSTRLHKQTSTQRKCPENALQTTHRRCAIHWKSEKKKKGYSSNACICLYRSLKLLTDDQVASQRFKSKHIVLSCVI